MPSRIQLLAQAEHRHAFSFLHSFVRALGEDFPVKLSPQGVKIILRFLLSGPEAQPFQDVKDHYVV